MDYRWKEDRLTLDYLPDGENRYRSVVVTVTGDIEHYDGEGDFDANPVPPSVMAELRRRMRGQNITIRR